MASIYGLWCECGCGDTSVRYIGQTSKSLRTRLTNHRSQARFGTQTPVYHWMRKHGEGNIRIRLLEAVEVASLDEREIWWIAQTQGLLNVTPGGAVSEWLRGSKRPDVSKMMTGSAHYGTKLTEGEVLTIRRNYTGTRGEVSRLAEKYGMSCAGMSDLLRGLSWSHVPFPVASQGKERVRLVEKDVIIIRKRRENGATLRELADEYRTSEANISQIVNRKTWKHVP